MPRQRRNAHASHNAPSLPPQMCKDCPADERKPAVDGHVYCSTHLLLAQEKAIREREAAERKAK